MPPHLRRTRFCVLLYIIQENVAFVKTITYPVRRCGPPGNPGSHHSGLPVCKGLPGGFPAGHFHTWNRCFDPHSARLPFAAAFRPGPLVNPLAARQITSLVLSIAIVQNPLNDICNYHEL
nr:MAG TPA: hypothetical protein [Caudoviricetes sp.]